MIVYTVYDTLNGCSGFATDTIEVEICIGVNDNRNDHFSVYPNPSQGIFTVSGINAGTVIEITDLSGKQVSRFTATASRADVDLSASADGVYFIRVINDNSVNTQRILLAR
jgi:hypothetical protein